MWELQYKFGNKDLAFWGRWIPCLDSILHFWFGQYVASNRLQSPRKKQPILPVSPKLLCIFNNLFCLLQRKITDYCSVWKLDIYVTMLI